MFWGVCKKIEIIFGFGVFVLRVCKNEILGLGVFKNKILVYLKLRVINIINIII
jgi:hypothetical protein